MLDLKPEGLFHFSAKGADDMPYELDLELFDAINLEVGLIVDWFYLPEHSDSEYIGFAVCRRPKK
jgi:hypothetical protein